VRTSPASYDIHDETRQRMLAETSRFIEWGLRHPDLVVRIPAKPEDEGGWPGGIAKLFWSTVLAAKDVRKAGVGIFRTLMSKLR
jgi:hypothetical protein